MLEADFQPNPPVSFVCASILCGSSPYPGENQLVLNSSVFAKPIAREMDFSSLRN